MLTRRHFLKAAAASSAWSSLPFVFESQRDPINKLASDPLRPQFHLLPAKNWMNDPNGPIYWQGHYHMFFQYNPNAAVWGDMHWAHAVSDDMIHWRHLPIALVPTSGWYDSDGCFTGSAVDDHGTATVLYTGVQSVAKEKATLIDGTHNFREVQCLATSSDPDLRTWTKYPQPVIEPPDDPTLTGFRDPFLWRQGEYWLLGVASGHFKKGGCVRLYRSKDLHAWEYLHELASGKWIQKELINPVDSGEMWECPDFFPLGKKYVLLYSTAGSVIWESGELDPKELVFHSERRGILDHGAYYAQKTQLDAKGNRILWGWIAEKRPDSELIAAGWAGCMALPRALSLGSNGDLQMAIAPEAHTLRARSFSAPPLTATPHNQWVTLPGISFDNLCAELIWRVSPAFPFFSLVIMDSSTGGAWWSITFTQDSGKANLTVNNTAIEVAASEHEPEFHLYLDGSVAELIFDKQHALTTRIYNPAKGPLHVKISDTTKLVSFDAWQLKPISPDRLTT
jgi:beta-fructofuranosidase